MSVVVDQRIDEEIEKSLKKMGIKYIKSCAFESLYFPVDTHPDMQIHFVDEKTAVVAPFAYEYYHNLLGENVSLIRGKTDPDSKYPGDCAYNVATIGRRVIGNLKYVDEKIKEIYLKKGFEFIDVKQGYAKCNLCIVDDNAAITEDEGLFKTLSEAGIEMLRIGTGEVKMPPFDYGFIGGASGFIAPKTLAFCGDLEKHSEVLSIKSFIERHKVKIVNLASQELHDFGSILYFL